MKWSVKEKEDKMKLMTKDAMHEKGYVCVNDYFDENIYNKISSCNLKNGEDIVKSINEFYEASENFHQPGGEGYKLVLNCLQKFLDFKFIRQNNVFRFDESLFDHRVSVISDPENNLYDYSFNVSSEVEQDNLEGTRADIYYLLNEADQNGIATRRCINYMNSNKLHLTAVLVQLIERIVENLESCPLKRHREYGRILRIAFMTPEYAECDVYELFEVTGCSKKQYYRLRNGGITLLSETLFGIFAGESGFANLYIKNNEIQIADLL